jgi:hypothetical protein
MSSNPPINLIVPQILTAGAGSEWGVIKAGFIVTSLDNTTECKAKALAEGGFVFPLDADIMGQGEVIAFDYAPPAMGEGHIDFEFTLVETGARVVGRLTAVNLGNGPCE